MWVTFNYNTSTAIDINEKDYLLDLLTGYQTLIVTSLITHRSGFLILGYSDTEARRFTAFILNETNLIQQAYKLVWRDVEPQNKQQY